MVWYDMIQPQVENIETDIKNSNLDDIKFIKKIELN